MAIEPEAARSFLSFLEQNPGIEFDDLEQLTKAATRVQGTPLQVRSAAVESESIDRLYKEGLQVVTSRDVTPESQTIKVLTGPLEGMGPLGKARAAELKILAAENQTTRLAQALDATEKKFRVIGEPMPDGLAAEMKTADNAGNSMIGVGEEKLAVVRAERQTSLLTQKEKAIAGGIEKGGRVTAFGDPLEDSKTLAKQLMDLTPEAREAKISRARTKAGRVRTGTFGAGGVLGALILSSLGKSIFGGDAPKDSPALDPQMQLALAAQLQKAKSGETLQQGRELRNVATLLGIIKQLRGVQGMQGTQTALPAII